MFFAWTIKMCGFVYIFVEYFFMIFSLEMTDCTFSWSKTYMFFGCLLSSKAKCEQLHLNQNFTAKSLLIRKWALYAHRVLLMWYEACSKSNLCDGRYKCQSSSKTIFFMLRIKDTWEVLIIFLCPAKSFLFNSIFRATKKESRNLIENVDLVWRADW